MLKHFLFTFIFGIFTLSYGTIYAGLDQHGRLDEVICVYRFENTNDSGPRNFHGTLRNGAELVMDGKYEKGLKLGRYRRILCLIRRFISRYYWQFQYCCLDKNRIPCKFTLVFICLWSRRTYTL